MLSDEDIKVALNKDELRISPFFADQLGPCSYDLMLSPQFGNLLKTQNPIDPRQDQTRWISKVFTDRYVLQPHRMVLASTIERVELGDSIAAQVEGKSSLARLGLMVHTAGFIDAGFRGQITLEVSNLSETPISLYSSMLIAQLCFFKLDTPTLRPYNGKYQDQKGVQGSRYHINYEAE